MWSPRSNNKSFLICYELRALTCLRAMAPMRISKSSRSVLMGPVSLKGETEANVGKLLRCSTFIRITGMGSPLIHTVPRALIWDDYTQMNIVYVCYVWRKREREIGKGVALKDPRWSVPSTGSCYTFYILVHLLYVYSMSINVQIMHQVQSEYEDLSRFNIYHVTYALYMSLTCVHEHKGSSRPGFHA